MSTKWLEGVNARPENKSVPFFHARPSDDAIVWRWDSDPFGTMLANENPSGVGVFSYGLRFPGQFYDSETGLHYNYYRDYDPQTGGYIQSDPIRIGGGTNTYAFVGSDPISFVDEFGLQASPGLGDQWNPGGSRGTASRDYTKFFEKRFPRSTAGAKAIFDQRIKKRICDQWPTSLPGLSSGADDIDIQPDMKRFGDRSQGWYERNVQIGAFEFKTDGVSVEWEDASRACSRCFSTTMYVLENNGDNRIPGFAERSVRMGNWPLSGKGCCGGY